MLEWIVNFLLALSLLQEAGREAVLGEAKREFYNGRYEEAESLTLVARSLRPKDPETYELRTTILLFRLRQEKKFGCGSCAPLVEVFKGDIEEGLKRTEEKLRENPRDNRANFLRAKLKLNRIWLNLEILDRKEGRSDYRAARKCLEELLLRDPNHIRALTAHAWIEYVVGGQNFVFWVILGGGSKDRAQVELGRALLLCRNGADEMDCAEAKFGFLEILRKEKRVREEEILARELRNSFPGNPGLRPKGK